jgi:hypothetical protein
MVKKLSDDEGDAENATDAGRFKQLSSLSDNDPIPLDLMRFSLFSEDNVRSQEFTNDALTGGSTFS